MSSGTNIFLSGMLYKWYVCGGSGGFLVGGRVLGVASFTLTLVMHRCEPRHI